MSNTTSPAVFVFSPRSTPDLGLEAEEEAHSRGKEPPAYWPTKTADIIVQDLTCSYAPELEPVLRGVSFEVKAGERVGICGRVSVPVLAMCNSADACAPDSDWQREIQ